MRCSSGRGAVAVLALGTAGLSLGTTQRPDLWKGPAEASRADEVPR